MINERLLRRALIVLALAALAFGLVASFSGHRSSANWIWAIGTLPVIVVLGVSIIRDFMAGRMGVDAVAFVSMSAALLLGATLAAIVVAVMYAGGNVLEDFAIARAERDLKSLVDRAPRRAHRRHDSSVQDIPVVTMTIRAMPADRSAWTACGVSRRNSSARRRAPIIRLSLATKTQRAERQEARLRARIAHSSRPVASE